MPETIGPPTNLLTGGNFFKQHPDKILGAPKTVSTRFGGTATTYIGSLDDLDKINIPAYALNIVAGKQPGKFKKEQPEDIIQHSEKDIAQKQKRKATKVATIFRKGGEKPTISFEEILNNNNPGISKEDMKVYLWYMKNISQPLGTKWQNALNFTGYIGTGEVESNWKKEQVIAGRLMYFRGDLLPAPIYLSGNIYERKTALANDKIDIVRLFTMAAYDAQEKALEQVFQDVYSRRLTLDIPAGQEDDRTNRLVINPKSATAETTYVETLMNELPFKGRAIQKEEGYGRPDFMRLDKDTYRNRKEWDKLTLKEAYQFWLATEKTKLAMKHNVHWEEIIRIYFNNGRLSQKLDKAAKKKLKGNIKSEAERMFGIFLSEQLLMADKVRLETLWNEHHNSFVPVDYDKIPIAFQLGKYYHDSPMDIRAEKREAVSFITTEGSGCLAYDVGFGKTWAALMTVAQFIDAGYCQRPFIIVPNQTYRQWINECSEILPHIGINDLYNLGEDYIDQLKDVNGDIQPVPEGTITFMTYEGFNRLSLSEGAMLQIRAGLYEILNQGWEAESDKTERQRELFQQKLDNILGQASRGGIVNADQLGIDFACWDEAHAMKKIFTRVKGTISDGKRGSNDYEISSGEPSSTGLRGFMMAHYIQQKMNGRNTLLLTATPFTNSPLEVFSMLALVAHNYLQKQGVSNLKDFFDTYINATTELVINAQLKPQRRQVFKDWNNLASLKRMLFRYFNYKNADTKDRKGRQVNIKRPELQVYPRTTDIQDGVKVHLPENEVVETTLEMTLQQKDIMSQIRQYIEGKGGSVDALCQADVTVSSDDMERVEDMEAAEVDVTMLEDKEKLAVKILRGIGYARALALSPYLVRECFGLAEPTYLDYIETSPKLLYVMKCIEQVREYHIQNDQPVSGQIIYMDRGMLYFPLIKNYLVEVIGYKRHEVGIISSKMKGGKTAKDEIKNAFNGVRYDEQTQRYFDIEDDKRIKVLIGSSSIREGMNLQRQTSLLYNLFIDWNPTDNTQLNGRLHRQGNLFNMVRVVIPLVPDSMDIFMFQKLQEKTSRINALWDWDGTTQVINEDLINPQELKMQLIKDPNTLVDMTIDDEREGIEEDHRILKQKIDYARELKQHITEVAYREKSIREFGDLAFPPKKDEHRQLTWYFALMKRLVKQEEPEDASEMKFQGESGGAKYGDTDFVSLWRGFFIPYWYTDVVAAYRILKNAQVRFFDANKVDPDERSIERYIEGQQDEAIKLQSRIDEMNDENYKDRLRQQIILEQEANRQTGDTVKGRLEQFTGQLSLLDNRKPAPPKIFSIEQMIENMGCPPMTEDGKYDISEKAISQLESCLAELPQTKLMHTKDGKYTAARRKIHDKIVKQTKKAAECVKKSDQPIAILTGGAPGSGKTTFLKSYATYLTSDKLFKIDADEIRSMLPEYKGWNADQTHEETKDIVDDLLDSIGKPCPMDILYDGTMNKAKNYVPLIRLLKSSGFKVFIIYITVDRETSIDRVLKRYEHRGRYVPLSVVNDVHDKGDAAFQQLRPIVDGWLQYDNITSQITDSGGEKIPQERYGIGTPVKELDNAKAKAQAELELLELELDLEIKKKNIKIRHKVNHSLSTNSVYHRFYDDKGREASIRLSDHDASIFRDNSDIDLPLNTSDDEVEEYGLRILESKDIPNFVYFGDKTDYGFLDRIQPGSYGKMIFFKDGTKMPLDRFENLSGLGVQNRTRKEEETRKRTSELYQELKDKGLYIHRSETPFNKNKEIDKLKQYKLEYENEGDSEGAKEMSEAIKKSKKQKANIEEKISKTISNPALVTTLYEQLDKKLLPYQGNEQISIGWTLFYLTENPENRFSPDYVDFYKTTHDLIPYLQYLVKKGVIG